MMVIGCYDGGGSCVYRVLLQVKREHYKALSHFYTALGLLDHEVGAKH